MTFIADLHIHSHYSRATSPNLVPEHLFLWARKKGISLVGTGDFTHPGWISELREKLEEAENGLYRLRPGLEGEIERDIPRSCRQPVRFVLTGEISCIYKRDGKTRKVHNLILMPDLDSVLRFNERLGRIGNITSDGRPILGLDSRDLLEIMLETDERAFFIPAHVWTPWFSLFGSKSGFDAIEECFGDLTPHIHALETGLSSDPPMNRLLSALDRYLLVSNSDAHSPAKLGREANLFDTPLDYDRICSAMRDGRGFEGTVEFFPEEGKYHFDGHRKCDIAMHPRESLGCGCLCPSCGKPMTLGVLHRIEELADRDRPRLTKPFHSLIPLAEILSEILACGPASKRVAGHYEDLLAALGPELYILMEAPREDIERAGGIILAEGIGRMRRNRVIRQEGYDGEYGVIRLFEEREMGEVAGQIALFAPKVAKKARRPRALPEASPRKKKEGSREPGVNPPGDPILDPLNREQRDAVLHQGGHLLIVAGPGTGKTMTLTHRIAHLIRSGQAAPGEILALTFTNKAAREMGERIGALLPGSGREGPWIATFHAFSMEILRRDGHRLGLPGDFSLCSEPDALLIADRVMSEAGEGRRTLARFLRELPGLKALSLLAEGPERADDDLLPLFRKYQEALRDLGLLDLDDLEVEALRLLRQFPGVARDYAVRLPWIFVDEYQDTSPLQVDLLRSLVYPDPAAPCAPAPAPRASILCAIGDPDQSIYGFRGADAGGFQAFGEDFPGAEIISLTRNYRSTQVILDSAAALMEKDVPLEGPGERGQPISLAPCRTPSEEAEMIIEQIERLLGGTTYFSLDSGRVASHEEGENLGFGDIAVLFRLNAQGDALEEAFSRAGIPFVRSGERPIIARHPVDIIWRFLQALRYPETPYFRQVYLGLAGKAGLNGEGFLERRPPARSLADILEEAFALHRFEDLPEEGSGALRRLREMAKGFRGDLPSFLDMLSLDRGIDHTALAGDRTALMSLHAAKGLEWPVVFITGCEEGLLPCTLFGAGDDEEERRLLYVGMTRARARLIISHAARRTLNGRPLRGGPSPFLPLIPAGCCAPLKRGPWRPKRKPQEQLGLF